LLKRNDNENDNDDVVVVFLLDGLSFVVVLVVDLLRNLLAMF
jgi:hypothetical protein